MELRTGSLHQDVSPPPVVRGRLNDETLRDITKAASRGRRIVWYREVFRFLISAAGFLTGYAVAQMLGW